MTRRRIVVPDVPWLRWSYHQGRASATTTMAHILRIIFPAWLVCSLCHAMPSMFGASTAEVWWLQISSHDSGGPWDGMLASKALTTPSFITGIFALDFLSGSCLGAPKVCWTASTESAGNMFNCLLQIIDQLVVLSHRKSILNSFWSTDIPRQNQFDSDMEMCFSIWLPHGVVTTFVNTIEAHHNQKRYSCSEEHVVLPVVDTLHTYYKVCRVSIMIMRQQLIQTGW